jgi:galactokinase
MTGYEQALALLQTEAVQTRVQSLYSGAGEALNKIESLVKTHQDAFHADGPVFVVSSPGRVELIGNHTDHNRGLVLAAAINLDIMAAVTPRDDGIVTVHSAGYQPIVVDLQGLDPVAEEKETSQALIRGVAAGMKQRGYSIRGFDAVMRSDVGTGSGLSSSAAFEVLICAVFDALYNGFHVNPVVRAQIARDAENRFFMKPSGLMDQMASSLGGLVAIDFKDDEPQSETLRYSFLDAGYTIMVVNTGGSHENLTYAYSAIPKEMREVARALGGNDLRDIPYERFLDDFPRARQQAGDRAVLRALHFYQENARVQEAVQALKAGDPERFLRLINASGMSSWTLLQNIQADPQSQPMAVALGRAQSVLGGRGAVRVHGGGFAGTTLNFVPVELENAFTAAMEGLFGLGACQKLEIRQEGAVLPLNP